MTSNFNTAANTIGNIATLGLTLGFAGMALNFAGKMIDNTQPRRKRTYDYSDYNMSYKKPRRKKQNIFDWDYNIGY